MFRGSRTVDTTRPKGTKITRSGQIGRLPAKYSFILNPYLDVRFSRCPRCRKLTYLRKFALLIHLERIGLRFFGKTCRYCPNCKLIIAHQNELERELARIVSTSSRKLTDDDYLVIGTVTLSIWRNSLLRPMALENILHHAADFKQYSRIQPKG